MASTLSTRHGRESAPGSTQNPGVRAATRRACVRRDHSTRAHLLQLCAGNCSASKRAWTASLAMRDLRLRPKSFSGLGGSSGHVALFRVRDERFQARTSAPGTLVAICPGARTPADCCRREGGKGRGVQRRLPRDRPCQRSVGPRAATGGRGGWGRGGVPVLRLFVVRAWVRF